jgi:hypothetical protein
MSFWIARRRKGGRRGGGGNSSGSGTFNNDCKDYKEDDDDNYEVDCGGNNDNAIRLAPLHVYRAFWEVNTGWERGRQQYWWCFFYKKRGATLTLPVRDTRKANLATQRYTVD